MAELVQRDRLVRVKLVYYGPALCGKTTNLQVLHHRAAAGRKGKLLSLNSLQDRTILFDLLPLRAVGPRGYEIAIQLIAVPGQSFYTSTRRTALKGADGVVFVANSAQDRLDENILSFRELSRHLMDHGIDPSGIPLVLQYNKRDLPKVLSISALDHALNTRREAAFSAVAIRGDGVVETFQACLARTMAQLARRYRVLELAAGRTPEDWARQASLGLFGAGATTVAPGQPMVRHGQPDFGIPTEFAADVPPAPPPAHAPHTIRVATAPEPAAPPGAGAAQPSGTCEAYAEACAEMASLLSEANHQRDEACRRLEEVRRAVEISANAFAVSSSGFIRRVLSCLAEGGGGAHASLVLWGATRDAPVAIPLPPLSRDPLAAAPSGLAYLMRAAARPTPFVDEAHDNLAVRALLWNAQPAFEAVAVVPLLATGRTVGLALLYYVDGDRLPTPDTLGHLGLLGELFASPLMLALASASIRSCTERVAAGAIASS